MDSRCESSTVRVLQQRRPNAKALHNPISDTYQNALRDPPAPVFKLTHKVTTWPDQNSLMQYLLNYASQTPAIPS